MRLRVHNGAKIDYQDAVDFYNMHRPGFGKEFILEIKKSFERIKKNPNISTKLSSNIRKYNVERFPFSVIYSVSADEDEIIVIAIMHSKRKPAYWEDRLN